MPVGDYKSIADKICILLKNRKKRLDLGLKGQLIVQQKYEWDRKIKEIETYYRSLINMKI